MPHLRFSAETNRSLWFPTLFAKNAKRMGHSAALRTSARAARFIVLAGVVACLAGLPLHAAAQDLSQGSAQGSIQTVAPTAQDAASTSTDAAKPEAADAGEAQNNAFRLEGPLVKWTAKTLHISVEAAARSFEMINLLIVVFGLGIPLYKFLPKFLRARREKLSAGIESARKVSEDAHARLSAIEAKLAGLDGEIAGIRLQVEEESKQDEARIKASITEESARIVAAAEQEISSSAAQARRSLRHFAADLAIEQAAKQLVLTPENDRALIAEFLQDVSSHEAAGSNGAHSGGQK
jgi:F-type H+-transporting ATPase subunit b